MLAQQVSTLIGTDCRYCATKLDHTVVIDRNFSGLHTWIAIAANDKVVFQDLKYLCYVNKNNDAKFKFRMSEKLCLHETIKPFIDST